ncbi:MAG: ABC transporter permease subunit [Acutalibacteraceae bacterium]
MEAAALLGAATAHRIIKYVIPNSMAPIIVQVTLEIAGAITSIAGLSFLGLGISRPPLSGAQCCPMPEAISATHGMSPSSRAWESCSPSWPLT